MLSSGFSESTCRAALHSPFPSTEQRVLDDYDYESDSDLDEDEDIDDEEDISSESEEPGGTPDRCLVNEVVHAQALSPARSLSPANEAQTWHGADASSNARFEDYLQSLTVNGSSCQEIVIRDTAFQTSADILVVHSQLTESADGARSWSICIPERSDFVLCGLVALARNMEMQLRKQNTTVISLCARQSRCTV